MSRAVALLGLLLGCATDVVLGELAPDATPTFEDASPPRDASAPDATAADAAAPPSDAGPRDAAPRDADPGDVERVDGGVEIVTLSFVGPPDVMCVDDLVGLEPQFMLLTPEDCGLFAGPTQLARINTRSWSLSGGAILDSFKVEEIHLAAGVYPDQPPEFLVSTLILSGSGPLDTTRRSGAIGVDRSTDGPKGTDGFVGVELGRPTGAGSCFMTFGLHLAR